MSTLPKKYDSIVHPRVKAAALVGVGGSIPGFGIAVDVAGMSAIWITMIKDISAKAGVSMKNDQVQRFATALLSAGAAYVGGSIALMQVLKFVPGLGMGLNAAFNATYTYKLACQLAVVFERGSFRTEEIVMDSLAHEIMSAVAPTPRDVINTAKMMVQWD